jgi:hypothetical protein
MKNKITWTIIIVVILTGLSGAVYVSLNSPDPVKAYVYQSENFTIKGSSPIFTFTDKNDLIVFDNSIKTAKKLNGILNVAAPEYIVRLSYSNNNTKSICLWLSEDTAHTTLYTDKNDTHTGYIISSKYTKLLKALILDNKQ